MKYWSIKIPIFIIITSAVALAVTSSWTDSIIVDEVPHIGAGYSYLTKHDMRLNPEHPPLAKDLATFPLLFTKLKQTAFDSKFWQEDVNGQWEFGRLLIFNSGNNADTIRHLVKLPMILFFVLSAVLIFKWARKLYGHIGSLVSLILFSFSPTVIAHSRFVTTDMAALFGVLLATYFFVKYLKIPENKNLLMAGLAFGIALLLKFSTFLLVPFFLILALVYSLCSRSKSHAMYYALRATIFVFLIGFIVVWFVYFLNSYNYPPDQQKSDTQYRLSVVYGDSYEKYSPILKPVIFISDKPLIRPLAQYFLGFLRVAHQNTEPHEVYFLGEISRFGWRKYFPIVYFIKEPLAWWGLVVIAVITATMKFSIFNFQFSKIKDWIKNHFDEFAMILWLIIYWGSSIQSTLNIGVRHLIPTYPFAILLVSGQISKALKLYSLKILRLVIMFLLAWYIYENLHIFPYYLTYFNQVVGGPANGYKYVVDSNIDWGQDLIRFSNWVKENNIPKIEFDYFGWADPSYYLKNRYIWLTSTKYKNAFDFKARNQSDGWLAVSATFLQNSEGPEEKPSLINYLWLKSYQPITVIGNSIFVYRIK